MFGRPPPFVMECNRCKWRRTFFPNSDVLHVGYDAVKCCPRCGNEELIWKKSKPSLIERILGR